MIIAPHFIINKKLICGYHALIPITFTNKVYARSYLLNTVFGALLLLAKQKALGKASQEKTKKVHDESGQRLD